jgi:catechol 2,3-dioxygenase-like lactoylglutathione lyase family enzyme
MNNDYSVKDYVLGAHHVGFFCSDLDETVRFYTEIFGFELLFYATVEIANERLAMMKLGNMLIEALWVPDLTNEELNKRALNVDTHFAILVTDIDEVKARLINHPKIKFEEAEIRHTPNVGDMDNRVTFFRGIDGERVEILQDLRQKVVQK